MYCIELQQTDIPKQISKEHINTFETRRIDNEIYLLQHTLVKGKVIKYQFVYYIDNKVVYSKEESTTNYQSLDNLINQLDKTN